jgi:hypothetical protein
MNLQELIIFGAKNAGSVAALGRIIDLSREATSAAKSQTRPLPIEACYKLSDYLKISPAIVVAINEMATEHDPEKIAYWQEYLAKHDISYIRHMMN